MKRNFYLGFLAFCIALFTGSAKAATVTTDPHDTTVCAGIHTFFTAHATGTSVTIHWQVSTDGSSWSLLTDTLGYTGSASDTLRIATTAAMNGYMYRAIAHDTTSTDTSATATLTVRTVPMGMISGPSAVCIGSTATLTDTLPGGFWYSAHTSIATVDSFTGVVTGVAFGFDTIRHAAINTCGTGITSFAIRVDSTAVAMAISGPAATCVGHTITLTNPNVLGTWAWSASNSTAIINHAGLLTGISHGIDTISYTFTNACNSVVARMEVTIDTVLATGTISGPAVVCTGSGITLTSSVSGGVWVSGSSATAVVDASGNVTGISAGTVVISYLRSNACGSSVATHTIAVARSASIITGGDSVGVGATLGLSDSATGGVWSITDTTIAVIGSTTGIVTGRSAGTTTVTYTVTNACGTSSSTLTIYVGVPPAVTITGNDSVCIGTNITLSAIPAGGTWQSGNDSIATITAGGVVTGHAYGLDTVYYTVTTGFGTVTTSKPIFVNQPPVVTVVGPISVAPGGNYLISATPYGGGWVTSNDSVGVIIAQLDSLGLHLVSQASFIMLKEGRDTLTYTITNTCGTRSGRWIANLPPASVSTVTGNNASLSVYPNPTAGSFTVNLASAATVRAKVTIMNALGAVVKELNIAANQPYSVQLDEPAGIYFLSAATANGRYDVKLNITR